MRALPFILAAAPFCLVAANKPWDCVKAEVVPVKPPVFELRAENACAVNLEHTYILMKAFDRQWNRIGIPQTIVINYFAPHEKVKRRFVSDIPGTVQIGIRKISDDPLVGLQ